MFAGKRASLKALLALLVGAVLSCADSGLDAPEEDLDADQPALDTQSRQEPDRTWNDGDITARQVSWRLVSSTSLLRSISVIGAFKITFVNGDRNRDLNTGILLRLVGGDGEWLVPETPLTRLSIPADSTIVIRENFVVEVKDRAAANAIRRMDLSIF